MRKEEVMKELQTIPTRQKKIAFLNGKSIDLRKNHYYLSMINNDVQSGEYRGLSFKDGICTPWERYPGFHHETAFIFNANTKVLTRKNKRGGSRFVMTIKNEGMKNSIFKFKTAKDRRILVDFLRLVLIKN